jgi:hypothetical protein
VSLQVVRPCQRCSVFVEEVIQRCNTGPAVDILARFLPRSGESREIFLSVVAASCLRGPAMIEM